jgi:hypothetical protein
MPSMTTRQNPRAPVRASGWPAPRMPRWVIAALVLFLAACVAVALVHKPSQAERASDMRGFLQEVTSDTESCAAGVSESLTALHDVQAEHYDNSQDVTNGIGVAQDGAQGCAPANNEQIDDLQSYQVPESLDSFGLANAVNALVQWCAADAAQVQNDVAAELSATTAQARNSAAAALSKDLVTLHAQGVKADAPIAKAIKALAMHASPPRLPS